MQKLDALQSLLCLSLIVIAIIISNLFLFLSALSIEKFNDLISCPFTSEILSQKQKVFF